MEPEIARRCTACGASVRGTAIYCPECGKPLRAGAAKADRVEEAPELPARERTDVGGSSSVTTASSSVVEPVQEIPAQSAASDARPLVDSSILPASEGEDRSKRHRVASREAVEGRLAPRVEKLRQASNVMLEEASYDPSLRFVLVAVTIFILSLLLLLLNHLLG